MVTPEIGQIEPGEKCIIKKEDHLTYIKSKVFLTSKSWISEDSGHDIKSHKKIWGSSYGAHEFMKISSFEDEINEEWFAPINSQ